MHCLNAAPHWFISPCRRAQGNGRARTADRVPVMKSCVELARMLLGSSEV